MKKKALIIGGIAMTAIVAAGWALAQSGPHGPGGFGPPFMQGIGPGGMGPGMMQHMAHAMGPGMGGMGPGMRAGMGPGMMRGGPGLAFTDPAQIESLKKDLGITTTQEPAWDKYVKTLQETATTMKTAREGVDPNAISKMSPQDRFAFVTKMREQGQKQFETVKTAANALLAVLNETQKVKAQETLPGLAFGPGAMRGAFMGGPLNQR